MTRRTDLPSLARMMAATLLLLSSACTNRIDGVPAADDAGVPGPDLAMAGPYADFPNTPIVDGQQTGGVQAPVNSGDLFGAADYGTPTGGPCLVEPQIDSLFPRNWLRLRFRFTPPAGHNLFEIRLHVENQINDLVVYTSATTWVMPADMWKRLAYHSADQPITVSIRSGVLKGTVLDGAPALGSKGGLGIAPSDAAGTIVYWTTTAGTKLKGFGIGDETVSDVIAPAQSDAGVQCLGCHSSTPDGNYVAYSQTRDPSNGDPAFIGLRSVDKMATEPPWLSAAAKGLLGRQKQQAPTFSASHWVTGDRILITAWEPTGALSYDLMWTDLEATSADQDKGWGILARQDGNRSIASPVFGHNGNFIVYTAATHVDSGIAASDGDIYLVPYNNRKGGMAQGIPGASDPMWNESHPALSPDDRYVAFNRVPNLEYSSNNVKQEVFMVARAGGQPIRLAANDAPACSGEVSPGINNSWPKWSPEVQSVGGRQFYWLSFSSNRNGGSPQLYVAPVVVDESGIKTYPALYLWNQPAAEGNHTAAWDVFKLIVG